MTDGNEIEFWTSGGHGTNGVEEHTGVFTAGFRYGWIISSPFGPGPLRGRFEYAVDPAGPRCTCGKRGCWERFASGSGLARLARESAHAGRLATVVELAGDPDAVRGEHVTAAASKGDSEARAVLDELGWWIALGLSNLALVLDPETIVLGGGLVDSLALVLDTVRRAFAELLEGSERRPEISIVPAALGERAGAIGAALLPGPPGRHRSARPAPRLAG